MIDFLLYAGIFCVGVSCGAAAVWLSARDRLNEQMRDSGAVRQRAANLQKKLDAANEKMQEIRLDRLQLQKEKLRLAEIASSLAARTSVDAQSQARLKGAQARAARLARKAARLEQQVSEE